VETAAISHRVADFLKKHPPFNAIDEADLLALAAHGRVRFHEKNQYILSQGEPHRHQLFVIQQGTVSLWDESSGRAELRDMRGAGDMLGTERYNEARQCLYTARAESDVVIYAFPQDDFSARVLTHPHAAQYVAAEGQVTPDYQGAATRHDPHRTFLHALVGPKTVSTCAAADTVASIAERMLATGSEAMAVLETDQRLRGVLTREALLRWVAAGGGDARRDTIEALHLAPPIVIAPDASVTDGVLAMATAGSGALAITADGAASGRVQALVTPNDLTTCFGEQPTAILRDIERAQCVQELRALNQRARALTHEYLTSAAAVEWLARLTHLVDVAIFTRILALDGAGQPPGCWCFSGSSGRGESLTRLAPHLVVIVGDGDSDSLATALAAYHRVLAAFAECDYLARELSFETPFYLARAAEWKSRYRGWLRDPVRQEIGRARTLFDLRPVAGPAALWQDCQAAITDAADRDVLHLLAHDCLANVPPLTFYENDVVDSGGEHGSTFRLEHSALRPLVDVGRVFGMATGATLGRSTLERFAAARTAMPEHERIFREAAETFRNVLWQQGRVGISQGTSGAELPPSLLSRHDRQVLKGGFRSILRLLEFTADRNWLARP
jgi:CBS domain-containing protein